ncbi:MAG: threonine--tRNA ligase [Candidatus Brocadiaceae bacterium]|nr:threonine--tRNA ligase [Candidatus Brocadiaceae bacterium]
MNVRIQLPDGTRVRRPAGATAAEVAASIGRRLAEDAVAASVDGVLMDLNVPLEQDCELRIITINTPEGLEIMRHSAGHVLACAVGRLFAGVRFGIGPSIQDGFYYDFDIPEAALSADDFERIEQEMALIVSKELPFVRREVPREEARRLMDESGQVYKVELLDEIEEGIVSLYQAAEFVDLCRGPHVPHTGKLGAFKLLSVAGAYWRGDSDRPQLQRVYATAWPTEKDLEDYVHRLEEAEKRDHRRLGRELDLFSFDEEIGQGLPLWHPRGYALRAAVEHYWRQVHDERGYEYVSTPHIASERIFRRSGHIPKYEDTMYAPLDIDGELYRVKPMNCPGHIKILQTRMRSYRDLPIRYAELGTVYRYELSGALHGMIRVRGFTIDDAHIFCTPEQLRGEIIDVLDLVEEMLGTFGYTYKMYLATRPEVYLEAASDEEWERATESLRSALEAKHLPYDIDEGGGAFYAPKIDVKLFDALGREWQGPTIQVDLNLPKRFDVTYVGEDGKDHECIIVHRAVLGSMERFVGGLIEHFAGWFPVWLAPEQARLLPITDAHAEYARGVQARLRAAGVRAGCDERNETMGYKVRAGIVDKVPYLLVVGDREAAEGTVSVRSHDGGNEGAVAVEDVAARIAEEIRSRRLPAGY